MRKRPCVNTFAEEKVSKGQLQQVENEEDWPLLYIGNNSNNTYMLESLEGLDILSTFNMADLYEFHEAWWMKMSISLIRKNKSLSMKAMRLQKCWNKSLSKGSQARE